MKKIMLLVGCCLCSISILLTGCSGKTKTDVQKKVDLSESALLGEWTLNKVSSSQGEATMAEMLDQKVYSDPDVFDFKSDGKIESQTNNFNITQFTWGEEDGKYLLYGSDDQKWDIDYTDDVMTFEVNGSTFELIKGAKTAEELLKAEGLWHVDELIITNATVNSSGNGFYTISYEIQNATSDTITFRGISIDEYDTENVNLKSYYSYNKNATFFELAPGNSGILELTFSDDSGIARVVSNTYQYTTVDGTIIDGTFSSPYEVKVI